MSARERVKKYRKEGGAADLARVEVLVAPGDREVVLKFAKELRERHRKRKHDVERAIELALSRYGARVLDNIDLKRLPDAASRAKVVAEALMERGDARAFAMARRLLDQIRKADNHGAH